MQSPEQSSAYRVAQGVQAAALAHPLRARLLMACTREERSLTELVTVLGAPLAKLHYHAAQLLDSGLLVVARSVPRGGRPVRYYRAVADRFEVPYEFLPQLPTDDWSDELRGSLRNEYERADLALLYAPDENGNPRVRLVRCGPDGPPRSFELWRRLRLNAGQQMELGRDLAAVLERYSQLDAVAGAEDLLVHTAFAPRRGG